MDGVLTTLFTTNAIILAAATVAIGGASLIFLRPYRPVFLLMVLVPAIAALAYGVMALGVGTAVGAADVNVTRYFDWLITTPLLLYLLAYAMQRGKPTWRFVLQLAILDIVMLLTGLAAEFADGIAVAVWFGLSGLAYLGLLAVLLNRLLLLGDSDLPFLLRRHVYRMSWTILVLWSLYPLVWIVSPEGFGTVGIVGSTVAYMILDVTTEVGFSILLLWYLFIARQSNATLREQEGEREEVNVQERADEIRRRLWYVIAGAVAPFAALIAVEVWQARSVAAAAIDVTVFVFAAGIAIMAAKVATNAAVVRYLGAIEELDRAKSDFISIASHQLKTPVSSLQYTLEAMDEPLEARNWETVETLRGDLQQSTKRLNQLVHDLLNISRIQSGTFEQERETCEIRERVESIIEELKRLAAERELSVETQFDVSEHETVTIDPSLLYNVIDNLLSNAFRYAREGSAVRVRVWEDADLVKVSVANEADNLSVEDVENLFTKFYRGSAAKETHTGGSGLGLNIAQSFIEAWGGDIEADVSGDMITITFSIPRVDNGAVGGDTAE